MGEGRVVKTLMTVKSNATPRPIVDSDHLSGLSGLNGHNLSRARVSARLSDATLRDDELICFQSP